MSSDRPTAPELIEAIREWLERDVIAATEGRVQFHARVAINALGMLERELTLGPGLPKPNEHEPLPSSVTAATRWSSSASSRRASAPDRSTTVPTRYALTCARPCGRNCW